MQKWLIAVLNLVVVSCLYAPGPMVPFCCVDLPAQDPLSVSSLGRFRDSLDACARSMVVTPGAQISCFTPIDHHSDEVCNWACQNKMISADLRRMTLVCVIKALDSALVCKECRTPSYFFCVLMSDALRLLRSERPEIGFPISFLHVSTYCPELGELVALWTDSSNFVARFNIDCFSMWKKVVAIEERLRRNAIPDFEVDDARIFITQAKRMYQSITEIITRHTEAPEGVLAARIQLEIKALCSEQPSAVDTAEDMIVRVRRFIGRHILTAAGLNGVDLGEQEGDLEIDKVLFYW